jgi:hypothetical protein
VDHAAGQELDSGKGRALFSAQPTLFQNATKNLPYAAPRSIQTALSHTKHRNKSLLVLFFRKEQSLSSEKHKERLCFFCRKRSKKTFFPRSIPTRRALDATRRVPDKPPDEFC